MKKIFFLLGTGVVLGFSATAQQAVSNDKRQPAVPQAKAVIVSPPNELKPEATNKLNGNQPAPTVSKVSDEKTPAVVLGPTPPVAAKPIVALPIQVPNPPIKHAEPTRTPIKE